MVDVTAAQTITIAQGATIEFGFNISNFANNSGSYNPYPTSLNFQILGPASAGQPSSKLPGSSQQYDPQFLLDAALTSANGSASVPLVDSAATRLGLKSGSMVITTGTVQGAQNTNVNMIDASVQMTTQESALIFGTNVKSASDLAYVVLHNDGPAVILGLAGGCDLRSAFVVSGVSGAAPLSTGGSTQQVNLIAVSSAPEPATYANLAVGLLMLMGFVMIKRVAVRRVVTSSMHSSRKN